METSVKVLTNILHVLGKIEQNTSKGGAGGGARGTGGPDTIPTESDERQGRAFGVLRGLGTNIGQLSQGLREFKGGKKFLSFSKDFLKLSKDISEKDAEKLKIVSSSFDAISMALPGLAQGLSDFGKLRSKRIEKALSNLKFLYDFMHEAGDARSAKRVDRASNTFKKLAESLTDVAKPIKTISRSLMTLGLGIVAFAASIVVAGKLLGLGGLNVVWGILGAIGGLAVIFGILAILNKSKTLQNGMDAMQKMGLGMAALALGIVSFSIAIAVVPAILGVSGNAIVGAGMVVGIIIGMAGIFWLIGKMGANVEAGVGVAVSMGIGMMALAGGVLVMALVARMIGGLGDKKALNKEGEPKGKFGQIMAGIGPGLGVMGIVLVGAALFFAGMGLLSAPIAAGVAVSLGMAGSMVLLSFAVGIMVKQAEKLKDKDVRQSIGDMITGVLGGFMDGISVLTGGERGVKGALKFVRNSAALMAGVAVLMSVSVALSMFAKALTAFVNLGNMRVIEGYKENGEPIFGQTVNIEGVGKTVGTTISSFLTELIGATTGLSVREARAIKQMGKALTGRRGILSAVIKFADVLKVFAQFGAEGKIGYAEIMEDENGNVILDGEGNPKMKKMSVSITDVVSNIVTSFGQFVSHLTSHTKDFEISGKEGRRMRRLGEVLLGKKGIGGREKYGLLQPIEQFAETLSIYGKFGANLEIPTYNEKGEPGDPISVTEVAGNIQKTLVAFVDAIGAEKVAGKTKDAEKNLKKYQNVIEMVSKTAKGLDDLTRLTDSTTKLAESIKLLSTNLGELDTSKLQEVAKASAAYVATTEGYNNIRETTTAGSPAMMPSPAAPLSTPSADRKISKKEEKIAEKKQEENWDKISQKIGQQVGAQMLTAMKAGQIKFIFSGGNEGILELE